MLQTSSCVQIYLPSTDKDQLLLELPKPARTAKALQALFDDRCLSYIKKEPMMEVLKDLVKTNKAITKAHNKSLQSDADGKPFNLLQMIIRCALQLSFVMQTHHRLCFIVPLHQHHPLIHPRVLQSFPAVRCAWNKCHGLRRQFTAANSNKRVTNSASSSKHGMAS